MCLQLVVKISNSKAYLAPSLEKDGGPVITMAENSNMQCVDSVNPHSCTGRAGETEERGRPFQIGRWQI